MTFRRIFFSELIFWVLFAGIGFYFLLPLRQSLRLGSDLVGGTFLTLNVHTEDAADAELVGKMQFIESNLKKEKKSLPTEKMIKNGVLSLTFATAQEVQDASLYIKELEPLLQHKVADTVLNLSFSDHKMYVIKQDAIQRNIGVLRMRLDKFSVAETPIMQQGDKAIVIELPDVTNALDAKAVIGKVAKLEFRLVDKTAMTKDDILYEYDGELPADKEVLPGKTVQDGYYLMAKYADITGSMLKTADYTISGERSEPAVSFSFNEEGSEKFYDLTSKNHGRQLAIVLDDVVISAPSIKSPIQGSGIITGRFTKKEAQELAMLLKSGSFVARVTFEEERQIGPALGEQARKDGIRSCLVGLGLLLIFSIFYYNLSGFFAFLALLYNMILVLMGLSWLGATLTLPGIGGMVLTIGMAIDASILIYERIKEELARGNAIRKSITYGFSDAMMVIIDANITTFIVGAVLYYFGTGPIQGFAVTMMLGVVATLISGLFFLRSLFMWMLNNFTIQKLRI